MELGFLPFRKYEITSRHLAEIGKMLGGWINLSNSYLKEQDSVSFDE